jgi:hypothetical protein
LTYLYLIAPQSNAHTEYAPLVSASDAQVAVTRVASAAIATVAALAPPDFQISLCDEAFEAVDFNTGADVVGITANVSQAQRALEIAEVFRKKGKTVIMGGPHVSLAPHLFADRGYCVVVGEFEPISDRVFADMRAGRLAPRYDGDKADLAHSPAPRWDLYKNDRAISGVVQTSRGCPFECHFCDVIQYLGRVQRHKEDGQVIAEVQALYNLGYNFISLADDNFTVYRKRAKSLLRSLAEWNGRDGRDYVTFATQMSIDVARDAEMLAMCNNAGLLNAFVGIESSDEASLVESKKRQNLHIDIAEQCRKIVSAGVRIEGGLMVGFDSDNLSAFRRQFEFAMTLPVGTFNLSVLVAPVATPLYEKMLLQGRIVSDEVLAQFPSANLITNIIPAQLTRDELYVGAKWLVSKLFEPENFFSRLSAMSALLAPPPWVTSGGKRRQHPSRQNSIRFASQVMRDLCRRHRSISGMVEQTFALMRRRPDIRDGIGDALTHYLMTFRSYEMNKIYDSGWAALDTPPFGIATADARLERIRAAV